MAGTLFLVVGPSGAGKDTLLEGAREFARRRERGDFMAWWSAHDLDYGLPRGLLDDLAAGRHVVANVSRGVIGNIAGRVANVRVVEITAPPDVLAARLENRGREDASGVAGRLARRGAGAPPGITVTTIMNDGTPDEGISRFVDAISG